MDDPAERCFTWAALLEKFDTTPAKIGALTDLQIAALYFHKRDKDGGLVPPEGPTKPTEPPTDEGRLRTIDQLELARLITPENAAELRERIKNGNRDRQP